MRFKSWISKTGEKKKVEERKEKGKVSKTFRSQGGKM